LKGEIDVRVINMHTLPVDKNAILKAAKETKGIVTAEEHQITGGLGSAVAEVLAENTSTKFARVGMQNCFGESGKAKELLTKYEMNDVGIIKKIRSLL